MQGIKVDEEIAGVQSSSQVPGRWLELWRGAVAVAPLLLGAVPFGLIYGVLAANLGLPPLLAQGMSIIIFAGSAQFMTVQLLQAGAPLFVVAVTGIVLNVRHVLYSASLAPYLQPLNRLWKILLAYLVTDESYAVTITRFWHDSQISSPSLSSSASSLSPPQFESPIAPARFRHWYVLGTSGGLWLAWQASTAVGIFLGAQVPAAWSLDFAAPLTFIALVATALRDRPTVVAAATAGVVVLLTIDMPLKLGLVTAMVAGIGAGWAVQVLTVRR